MVGSKKYKEMEKYSNTKNVKVKNAQGQEKKGPKKSK